MYQAKKNVFILVFQKLKTDIGIKGIDNRHELSKFSEVV